MKNLLLLSLAPILTPIVLSAAPVLPLSYDMINGHGQASSGSYNYWDKDYTGAGSTTTDGAPLSGGLGDLTDGVIATDNWFNVENAAGTGPYVGWRGVDPVITFHFALGTYLNSLTLFVDDSNGSGGVSVPGGVSLKVDGNSILVSSPLLEPAGMLPVGYILDINSSVTTLELTLHRKNEWVFGTEVAFDGTTPVPDAGSTLGLLTLTSLALGTLARRRA